jgi:hypothetical protein
MSDSMNGLGEGVTTLRAGALVFGTCIGPPPLLRARLSPCIGTPVLAPPQPTPNFHTRLAALARNAMIR